MAACVALAAASPSMAGTLGFAGTSIVYVGDPLQASNLTITREPGALRFVEGGGDIVLNGVTPCSQPVDPSEAVCTLSPELGLLVSLGDGDDQLTNETDIRLIACGGDGEDVMRGGSGIDWISGGSGRDQVFGGDGADLLAVSLVLADPGCLQQTFDHFELLDGGPGPDLLEGGSGADWIEGGDGDEVVFAHGGADRVDGAGGSDNLLGLEGSDSISGGDGRDFLFGGGGDDRLEGGPGSDVLGETVRHLPGLFSLEFEGPPVTSPEVGDDRLDGGPGDDELTAGPGNHVFDMVDPLSSGGAFVDRRLESAATNGTDVLVGGSGVDTVTYLNRALPIEVTLDGIANDGSAGERDRVDSDVENVLGGARDDVLRAGLHPAFLFGDRGEDLLLGGPGADILSGGADADDDSLRGATGDDELRGGPGQDLLEGQRGADFLIAGGGDDALVGGLGIDSLEGGAGADDLDGGPGADCLHGFVFPAGFAQAEPQCPHGDGSLTTATGADRDDVLRGGSGHDVIAGGGGEDTADYSDSRRDLLLALARRAAASPASSAPLDELAGDIEGLRGGRGDDVLLGNWRDNVLDGGPGDDQVRGGAGQDRLRGGAGIDLMLAGDGEPDAVQCGPSGDYAVVDSADEIVATLTDACERLSGAQSAGRASSPSISPAGDCELAFRPPGAGRSFTLGTRATVAVGTWVDARGCAGHVWLAGAAAKAGRAATVALGALRLRPGSRGLPLHVVPSGGRRARCNGSARRLPRLSIANAPSGLAVRGRQSLADGPDASWITVERCRGTRTRVRSGRVTVRYRGRTHAVTRGQTFLARSR